jgi:hypothetical protein
MQDLDCTFPIQVMSDLHLEFSFRGPENNVIPGYDAFDCKPCSPVLALLGDIGLVSHEGLFVFLRRQLLKYEKILYVMGNHEFYSSCYVCIYFFPFTCYLLIYRCRNSQRLGWNYLPMKSRSKETQKMPLGSLSCWTKQESISTPEPPSSGVPFGRISPPPLLKKSDFDLMTLSGSLNGLSRPTTQRIEQMQPGLTRSVQKSEQKNRIAV